MFPGCDWRKLLPTQGFQLLLKFGCFIILMASSGETQARAPKPTTSITGPTQCYALLVVLMPSLTFVGRLTLGSLFANSHSPERHTLASQQQFQIADYKTNICYDSYYRQTETNN
jgi:hypothetical protein